MVYTTECMKLIKGNVIFVKKPVETSDKLIQ